MEKLWKVAPWLSRVLLILPVALFAFLGIKYFADPVGTTATDSILLASPAAVTDMRVVGSIFLACSLITLFFLASRQRLLAGMRFVLTVVGAVTFARLYGVFMDGAPEATVLKLKNELVLVVLFTAGLMLETLRHRRRKLLLNDSVVSGGRKYAGYPAADGSGRERQNGMMPQDLLPSSEKYQATGPLVEQAKLGEIHDERSS